MVWDPDKYVNGVIFWEECGRYYISGDLGHDYEGRELDIRWLKLLVPSTNVKYIIRHSLDSWLKIDTVEVVNIACGIICWKFDSNFQKVRIVENDNVDLGSWKGAYELLPYSLRVILGDIYIFVFDKPERIIIE